MPLARVRFAVSDGTNTRDRLDALPNARSRAYLRFCLRMALGAHRRYCRTDIAFAHTRDAAVVSDCGMYGV